MKSTTLRLAAILLLASTALHAQSWEKKDFSYEYSMGIPVGSLADFINETSFRGFTFAYQNPISDNISFGLEASWNVFNQELPYATYTIGTESITGEQFRYLNSYPILLGAQYHYRPTTEVDLALGLGMGIAGQYQAVDMGQYRISESSWQFLMRPELIANYEIGMDTDFRISAKYYGAFSNNTLDGRSFVAINVGFAFHRF
jgi:hypothetical protein